ncbi:MAG: PucR family transcriptional regulator ligand-binding domain-containing protein, partial [Angelakisella sp.]
MSIVCGDLLELGYFKKMKLVAGRGGLNRRLTWPYVGQTTTVSQWVHGGELLFITGIGRDNSTDSLETLVSECVSKGLCGLVLLVGSEYIREIPPSIVLQADSCGLPLFEMPWDIKLIDVTSEIVDLIMLDKYERRKTDSFLNRLLFPQAGETATVSELAEAYRVKLNPFCFIA